MRLGPEGPSGAVDFEIDDDPSFARMLSAAVRLPAADAPPVVGDIISGKYRVEESLGRGGMGQVFRAVHLWTGHEVAIKWLLPGSPDALQRFKAEARAATRIQDPAVVDVYDIAEHRDLGDQRVGCYLVMQLLRGETLAERIARGSMSPGELVDIMLLVLDGVAAAHARGVIHRDIKPANIMLCPPAHGRQAVQPKLLDFGISKLTCDATGADLTCARMVLGTFPFMAPEQHRNPLTVDVRADIHALGVTMFAALTGDRFPEASLPDDPELVLRKASEIPRALTDVVLKAMADSREDRFSSAAELREALLPWATQRQSEPPAMVPSAQPLLRPRRAAPIPLTVAALSVFVLGASVGGLVVTPAHETLRLCVLDHPSETSAGHASENLWTGPPLVHLARATTAPPSRLRQEPPIARDGRPRLPRTLHAFPQLAGPLRHAPAEPRPDERLSALSDFRDRNHETN